MRFMVIVKGCNSETGKPAGKEALAAMGKYNEELKDAGVLLTLEGLAPISKGARVKFSGKQRTVTDGPFAESKELIGGFWLWKCDSLEEAIGWLKHAPFEDAEVEIREVQEGFAENFARAFQEQELETVRR